MKNRRSILLIILLITIGFAAVATNLFINGSSKINPNQDDFNVYYSDAYVNDVKDLSVITSNRVIEFTTIFESLGQKYTLEYEVTNASKNYDAELVMECTGGNEYLTVTNEFDDETILPARDYRSGKLTIEQTKSYAGDDLSVSIECIIDANAIERDTLNEEEIQANIPYIFEGTYVDENNTAIANANLVVFSDTPHYITTDASGYVFYNGLERGNHEIYHVNDTLENIKNMTKDEIIANALTSGTFTTRMKDEVVLENNSRITNLNIEGNKAYCENIVGKVWEFNYTGKEQSFLSLCDGEYKIELWGAAGNTSSTYPAYGSYVAGNLEIEKNQTLYVYVGQKGSQVAASTNGFNGGGIGNFWCKVAYPSASHNIRGGGATDVRLVNGTWSNFESLKSRIMVAAGAGGSTGYAKGGHGGGLNGYSGSADSRVSANYSGTYATQIKGGNLNGSFGKGGTAKYSGDACSYNDGAGGGGGYYGGGGSRGTGSMTGGTGAGGSSFISGHQGCNAVKEDSTSSNIVHTGEPYHYSGYVFTNTKMIDGAGYSWTTTKGSKTNMPTFDGTSTMTGNSKNGYAKITYIG